MTNKTPPADLFVDIELIRRLIYEQCPEYSGKSIQIVGAGWDNYIYRLGNDLALRLPRRKEAIGLIQHEQRWLPKIQKLIDIPIPAPVFKGKASEYYNSIWSIIPWFEGRTANLEKLDASELLRLVENLRRLHIPATDDAPDNPLRGVPLIQRKEVVEERLEILSHKTELITSEVYEIWNNALDAEVHVEERWIHGDLHSRNIIVNNGKITALIDWGDMTIGDVATDLACLWMLIDDNAFRKLCLDVYEADDALRRRSAGWAVFYGAVLLATGLEDHEEHAEMVKRIFENLISDT